MYKEQMDVKALVGQWKYGVYVPYDVLFSRMAQHYATMESKGQVSPIPVNAKEQQKKAEANLLDLGTKGMEGSGRVSLKGQEAIDFDRRFLSAKAQAKSRTPMITSVPGLPAKRSATHE
jgi:hypothetical protein